MRVNIGVLCFILMVLLDPIESMLSRLKGKMIKHFQKPAPAPRPILSAEIYLALVHAHGGDYLQYFVLDQGPVDAVVMKENDVEYIVGIVRDLGEGPELCALVDYSELHRGNDGKIKIRVEGDFAYKYIPILKDNPLNDVLEKPYHGGNIRSFEIVKDPTHPLQRIMEARRTQRSARDSGSRSSGVTLIDQAKYIDSNRQRFLTTRANQPIDPEKDNKLP